MNQAEIEKIILSLIDTFVYSGKVCLDLRKKGLKKEIKSEIKRKKKKITC